MPGAPKALQVVMQGPKVGPPHRIPSITGESGQHKKKHLQLKKKHPQHNRGRQGIGAA